MPSSVTRVLHSFPTRRSSDLEPIRSGKVDWVTGAVLVARRAALETVGLLDERYFMYWEDMDWCYRMRRAGWGVFLVPDVHAIHLDRKSTRLNSSHRCISYAVFCHPSSTLFPYTTLFRS